MKTRTERDSIGELKIPRDAYYGIQTARAIKNFPISKLRAHPDFIWALGAIKKAAAITNKKLGMLDKNKADSIVTGAEAVMAGKHNDQFAVDVFQAGAGTSLHMNANEVIANCAIMIHGGEKGDYTIIHPNDHVNFGQSTNDVFPTAMRLAILKSLPDLTASLENLSMELTQKGKKFTSLIKSGRTHLQDAVPVTLGQEFNAYGGVVRRCKNEINSRSKSLIKLGIGGSAAGTGLNTHPDYQSNMTRRLSEILEIKLIADKNLFKSMQSMRPFSSFSGSLKELALELIRIANDIRLLSSGPNTGLNEIFLPAVQPGSSIMPGKVNPVMAEMLDMVCFQVIGNDTAVSFAAQAGQLELNVMMPIIIHNILHSMEILTNATRVFSGFCIKGIKPNKEKCRDYFEHSLGLATVLNTLIGYDRSAKVMKKALTERKTVLAVIEEEDILSGEEIKKIFSDKKLTRPGIPELS